MENQATLDRPRGRTMNAASSGPSDDPAVAAGLKERLRQAVPAAGRRARDPRRLGMEDRRTDADQGRGQEQQRKRRRHREQQQSAERETHADRQRVRLRMPVGVEADERLQQRRGHLTRQA